MSGDAAGDFASGHDASEIRQLTTASDAASDDDLARWYEVSDRTQPWLRANFVASLDGAATHNGLSAGLGSPSDKRVFDVLRRLADVVIVGAGTVRAEGYGAMELDDAQVVWRRERSLAEHPVFAIVSSSLRLDPNSEVFTKAPVRPIVLTCRDAPAGRREALSRVADVIDCGETAVDTRVMRERLVERGLPQMHSEGGPHLLGAMIEEGTVDELCLTLGARLEGGMARRITDGRAVAETNMELAHAVVAPDGTLLLRYTRA